MSQLAVSPMTMEPQRAISPIQHRRRGAPRGNANQVATSTSVIRAFAILDILSAQGKNGLPLTDTAHLLRMSKSTTHRYLITLEKLGAVERDEQDRFRLGLKVVELAGLVLSQNSLHKQSEPFLNELADRTRETIHLAVPIGIEVVYIDKVDSPRSLRMFSRIGSRAPMYCTALGKAILAYSNSTLVDEVLEAGLSPHTPHTITTRDALLADLKKVRQRGYALDAQENELGVCCIGTPIFDYSGQVVGAISISGPAERMTAARQREFGPAIRDTGLRLSKRMGYSR